jgi:phosphatidylglycerophosphatase A
MTPENPTISPVPASAPRRKPSVRFLLAHPSHFLALGFGSGLSPIMPGTVGTLLGWLMFHQFSARWPSVFTPWVWGLIIVLGFVLGIWACERTGRALGVADHGGMVWDEIIAIWLVLLLVTPCSLGMEAVAFLLFRFFDMSKPPPIGNFERRFKNGFGVMGDDILAAFFTLLAIALWPYL